MKTDLFQSCGHCWVFQISWHIECSTFTPSSFRIWNSSTGIPSPPLALFLVMLPKAHLTSHSRMSGSRWVITPSWLSGSLSSFLYSSFVYSCHPFLISSASIRSIPFLSFIVLIFAWNVPLVSLIFLKRSVVFPIIPWGCVIIIALNLIFHGLLDNNMLNLSIFINIKLLRQKGRCAKIGTIQTKSKFCVCMCLCLHMYVLTVLVFKIFLDNDYRSQLISTTKQNFLWM